MNEKIGTYAFECNMPVNPDDYCNAPGVGIGDGADGEDVVTCDKHREYQLARIVGEFRPLPAENELRALWGDV